jgi:aryl-alcohol dehydrogenase-like predicted oxidoreductase
MPPSSAIRVRPPGWRRCGRWPRTPARRSNRVVLAWLTGAEIPVIPLVGASSVAQLDESLAAVDPELTTEQRTRLDAAR